jgi:protein-tyrosine phosphatase
MRGHGYYLAVQFLFVCTANICRSPMAAAFFAAGTQGLADSVEVTSAGLPAEGQPTPTECPTEVLEAMETYGIDLGAHRSRELTESLLSESDLIVGMGTRHVQEAVLLDPSCWKRTFKLKELVRRGEAVGPRRPDQGVSEWIEAVQGDRTRASLVNRSTAEEVADPYGGPPERYRSTATELGELVVRLTQLLWPDGTATPQG